MRKPSSEGFFFGTVNADILLELFRRRLYG
jgi:hypothetical protein